MIDKEKIAEWKAKYKYIYRSVIAGQEIIFKTLGREDYIDILAVQAVDPVNFDHDLEVFKRCVLTEYDVDEVKKKGGITTVISEKIMIASGFEVTETEEL